MPSLLELQRVFAATLIGDGDDAAALIEDAAPGAAARLAVYRDNVFGALPDALRLTYPTVDKLVGSGFFDAAAAAFIRAAPPRSGWLGRWGGGFADFLADLPAASSLPYLRDAARLDHAVDAAYYAPDSPTLDIEALAAVAPEDAERLILPPHPSLTLIDACAPVDEIRAAIAQGREDELSRVDMRPARRPLAVSRAGTRVAVRRLSESAFAVLSALAVGAPLGRALAVAPGLDAGVFLAERLRDGCFAAPLGYALAEPKDEGNAQ